MSERYISHIHRDCVIREADGIHFLYHRPAGQTHILPPHAYLLLEAAAAAPASFDDLLRALATGYALDGSAEERAGLLEHLATLIEAGLIETMP
ncbi:HPr-rel-A system PqqD family peptide chaperone [Parapedomonas caeni]